MVDMVIEKSNINLLGLDGELRSALGEATSGLSVVNGTVIVHVLDEWAQPTVLQQARQIVLAHDASAFEGVAAAVKVEDQIAQLRQQLEALLLQVTGHPS